MLRVCLLLFSCSLSLGAWSADSDNKFAAVGAGVASCERYLQAREKQSDEYFLFGGWIDGYFSARNQFEPDTYTLLPWQSVDVLAGFLTDYCRKHPELAFQRAVMIMAEALRPARLQSRSERVQITVGQIKGEFFAETIERMERKLAQHDLLAGSPDEQFDEETVSALSKFQRVKQLAETGFPDQLTLYKLFVDNSGL